MNWKETTSSNDSDVEGQVDRDAIVRCQNNSANQTGFNYRTLNNKFEVWFGYEHELSSQVVRLWSLGYGNWHNLMLCLHQNRAALNLNKIHTTKSNCLCYGDEAFLPRKEFLCCSCLREKCLLSLTIACHCQRCSFTPWRRLSQIFCWPDSTGKKMSLKKVIRKKNNE